MNVVHGVDFCRKLDAVQIICYGKTETWDSRKEVENFYIRTTGRTNMLDVPMVQHIANEMYFYELVVYIEEYRKEYVQFILTGEQ